MADVGLGSLLNFNAGISRVVWGDAIGPTETLPDLRQLAPTELTTTQQLDRLLQADNIAAVLARGLRPVVGSPDILRPDRFEDALQSAGMVAAEAVASADDEDKQALEELGEVLAEHRELKAALDYFRDMLIAG
jgi:hypothetical protein